jgi:CDP-diacylglycerol pyrophosphatase
LFRLETSIVFAQGREEITMNQKTADQEWQQLQAHIEGFFGQALRKDVQKIEYKPRFIAQLLEMPSERRQNELREMST